MDFYNLKNIDKLKIHYPDIYFTPEYGKACEYSDNAEWELCQFKDLIYVYLKRTIECGDQVYYDLITPYGYSGYYYEKEETYKEFIPIFRKKAKERGYITEVVRQNPYLDINITEYDIITCKTIYGIKINDFESYFNKILHAKKRNMYKKAIKLDYSFKLINLTNNLLDLSFIKLYNENMEKVNAAPYYFFNKPYFNSLEKINNAYLALVLNKDKNIIGASIVFTHNDTIHYHLSCNNNSDNCITDFLLINVLKMIGLNKLFILGGGVSNNDGLCKFKQRLSNKKYNYIIYKNILNHEIYDKLNKNSEYFPSYRA